MPLPAKKVVVPMLGYRNMTHNPIFTISCSQTGVKSNCTHYSKNKGGGGTFQNASQHVLPSITPCSAGVGVGGQRQLKFSKSMHFVHTFQFCPHKQLSARPKIVE